MHHWSPVSCDNFVMQTMKEKGGPGNNANVPQISFKITESLQGSQLQLNNLLTGVL